jgi:hypothetical protein
MCDAADRSHTLNHYELERDSQLTHHAQEPSIGLLHRNPLQKSPLGTAISESSTQRRIPTNFSPCRQALMQRQQSSQLPPPHHHTSEHSNFGQLQFAALATPWVRQPIAKNPDQSFAPQTRNKKPVRVSRRTKTYSH